MRGVATGSCSDYGCIHERILFNAGVMPGNEPLQVKPEAPALTEVDQITHGSNAITVRVVHPGYFLISGFYLVCPSLIGMLLWMEAGLT